MAITINKNMWRTGVLVLVILLEITSADVKNGVHHELAQRFKRTPHYHDCEPRGPPPPPPPFWPPPPPQYWRHHHHHPPPNVGAWDQQPQFQAYSQAQNNAATSGNANDAVPCTTCGGNGNNAVSNANSESGRAVAVAIARPSPQ